MQSVYPGVFRLDRSLGSNGYLVEAGERVAVIDPGLDWGAGRVLRELASARVLEKVTDILITHYDRDHVGATARLQAVTGATVWIGRADAEVLEGTRRAGTAYRRLLARVPLRPFPGRVQRLDGEAEVLPGVRALPTPGHTDGHLAFVFFEVLFAGDAVLGDDRTGLTQFPRFITTDRAAALRSEEVLRGLGATWLCPGHGRVRELRRPGGGDLPAPGP
ncbi:MBL fold metallo-hydrolase [Sinomonas mesophila]|uniref:MBL fold metallo-hydrolase n=1 Tax=Sinomonas mesophila TaxID=1531955 RepID=UPI001588EA16|nr:MBL fold metallo-hydrolase [Sinomonas mesophila]